MNKMKKKLLITFVCIGMILGGEYLFYASKIYHSLDYTIEDVSIEKKKDYYVIGGTTNKVGFIFYPGAFVDEKSYIPLLSNISKANITCFVVSMPFHLAVLNSSAASNIMKDYPYIDKWNIGGHSLGGAMAGKYANKNEKQLESLILLAAYSTEEVTIPTLSIYGDQDGVLNKEKYNDCSSNLKELSQYIIKGGNHAQFGYYGPQKGDGIPTIDLEEQQKISAQIILEFLEKKATAHGQ